MVGEKDLRVPKDVVAAALTKDGVTPLPAFEVVDEVRQTGTWDSHGGVNLIEASIDFETFLDNPAEWAGQFAPEVLITIATGGGGTIAKIGTTATRATNAARRAATTARRILPNATNLADIRRITSQWLDELAVTLFPQPGLRPAWADNIHMSSNTPGSPQSVNGGSLPPSRTQAPTAASPSKPTHRRIAGPDGVDLPGVPEGVTGVLSPTGRGIVYDLPPGTPGLDPRVTQIRVMDPVTTGKFQHPTGYVVYMNKSGQTVNPITGRTIARSDPFAHIKLP